MTFAFNQNTPNKAEAGISSATPSSSGWQASLNLVFSPTQNKTILSHREQRGPLAVQRPLYPEGKVCHCYLLHPPGGVVGGDSLTIDTRVESGSHALITTPGATKFYLSDNRTATQNLHLKVENGAILEWFPLENIYFSGAIARLNTRIELEENAQFMGWEMHCFGRPALNEGFLKGKLSGKTEILINNKPYLIEGLDYQGRDKLFYNNELQGSPTMGSLYISGADDEMLKLVQALLQSIEEEQENQPNTLIIAVTCLEDLMVVRALGKWSEDIMSAFIQVRALVREHWVLKPSVVPRIWAT